MNLSSVPQKSELTRGMCHCLVQVRSRKQGGQMHAALARKQCVFGESFFASVLAQHRAVCFFSQPWEVCKQASFALQFQFSALPLLAGR